MHDFTSARLNMVENQLRPNRVDDERILAAMADVPRELFVPAALRSAAYGDEDIDLGDGRHLIEPLVLGRMLQCARVKPSHVGLVIGCDTGYCAAVMAQLAGTVFFLAEDDAQETGIDERMNAVGADNVVVQTGAAADGLADQAPFDVILLGGSVESVPETLLRQLGDDGRLVGVMQNGKAGKISAWQRIGEAFGSDQPFDAMIPRLRALQAAPTFIF